MGKVPCSNSNNQTVLRYTYLGNENARRCSAKVSEVRWTSIRSPGYMYNGESAYRSPAKLFANRERGGKRKRERVSEWETRGPHRRERRISKRASEQFALIYQWQVAKSNGQVNVDLTHLIYPCLGSNDKLQLISGGSGNTTLVIGWHVNEDAKRTSSRICIHSVKGFADPARTLNVTSLKKVVWQSQRKLCCHIDTRNYLRRLNN